MKFSKMITDLRFAMKFRPDDTIGDPESDTYYQYYSNYGIDLDMIVTFENSLLIAHHGSPEDMTEHWSNLRKFYEIKHEED